MKYDINKTAVVPYIVAERALWNVIEGDEYFKDYLPLQIAGIVEGLCPKIVEKAERIYGLNPHFRKQLNDKRKDIRYTLEMFMEHWALLLIKHIKKQSYGNNY